MATIRKKVFSYELGTLMMRYGVDIDQCRELARELPDSCAPGKRGLPSRKRLEGALDYLDSKGVSVKSFSNEVFGKKAFYFVTFGPAFNSTPAELVERNRLRFTAEAVLHMVGYNVESKYNSTFGGSDCEYPTAEIQVAWFKGYHWDE